MKTLEQVVTEYNIAHGYDNDVQGMYETFVKVLAQRKVQESTSSEHRWYDVQYVVYAVVIDGVERYFETFDYHITGDNCASDMGLETPTLDDVREVFPHEVVTTVYR